MIRKITTVVFIIFCVIIGNAQNNIIIQQNNTNIGDNQFKINGIPMSEDIGGVDISQIQIEGTPMYFVRLTNYNDFIVNVVYQFTYGHDSDKKYSGNMVLRPGESKETERYYYRPNNCICITRELKKH